MHKISALALVLLAFGPTSGAVATDRYWSGGGGSDNISDASNWFSSNPNTGDNLNWNNTTGSHHFSYFNYGDYYTFGTLTFYSGANGGQVYGNALQFTTRLENNSDPNQWRVYNSNVAVNSDGTGTFAVNPMGGDVYVKLDASSGTGSGNGGSFYFNGNTMNVYGGNGHLLTLECILANGSGTSGFTLQQNSLVRFTGSSANVYTGPTTLNAGTLYLTKPAGVNAIAGNVVVNSTGSLALEASNQIADSAQMTLGGGRFNTGGLSEHGGAASGPGVTPGVGALTLSGSSIIDLGSGASILAFANSSAATWTGGTTLSIYNWSGTRNTGGGTDELFFGTSAAGLTSTELSQIRFYSDSGTTLLGTNNIILTDGEVVPTPEPATWLAGFLTIGLFGYAKRQRLSAVFAKAA